MLKNTLMAASLATILGSGGALGASLANDGQGDLLISPSWTVFQPGVTTDFEVVNTDRETSVVAKLIIREELTSRELVDVMIYLSPGDRWLGSIVCTEFLEDLGCVRGELTSTDDSMLAATTINIPIADPDFDDKVQYGFVPESERKFGQAFGDGAYKFGDGVNTWNQGYAEVIMSRRSIVAPPIDGIPQQVDKNAIYNEDWNNFNTGSTIVGPLDTPNTLAGMVTMNILDPKARIGMTAISNYNNLTQLVVGVDTFLGDQAATNMTELESVLARNEFVMPYNVGEETYMIVTFPTKLDFRGPGLDPEVFSPYFWGVDGVGNSPFYLAVVRNDEEVIKFVNVGIPECRFNNQSPPQLVCDEPPASQIVNLTRELNVIPVKQGIANIENPAAPEVDPFFSESGWVNITIQPAGDLYNGGVPAIVTFVTSDGRNLTWNRAAAKDTVPVDPDTGNGNLDQNL